MAGGRQVDARRMMSRLVLLCALTTLAACGGSNAVCTRADEPYLAARDHPELRVPPDLTQPDRSGALTVPEPRPEARQVLAARTGRGACLDQPPSYFRASGTVARSPEEVVASWAQAWANREADGVIALYSTAFTAPTDAAGAGAWLEQRREQVATGPVPDPVIEGLKVVPDGPDRRVVTFVQRFGANSLRKELTLVRESGSWRIVAENVLEVR